MARSARPLEFVVILDANALRGKDWIQKAISEFVEIFNKEPKVAIDVYIPEVVQREWMNNFVEVASTLVDRHSRSSVKLRFMLADEREPHQYTKENLSKKGQERLDDLGIKTLKMDYSKVPVEDLLERALNKLPPFKPNSDEGFKDAVIAETIFNHAESTFEGCNIVVITNDQTLKAYLQERAEHLAHELLVFDSIPDFESHLNLKINELGDELAAKAKQLFYSTNEKESLFYSESLGKKIESLYAENFPDEKITRNHLSEQEPYKSLSSFHKLLGSALPTGTKWLATDQYKLEVSDTVFIGKKGRKLVWENTIILVRYYEVTSGAKTGVVESPGTVKHRAEFKVRWETSMTPTNLLSKPSIVESPSLDTDSAEYKPVTSFSPLSSISNTVNTAINPLNQIGNQIINTSTWNGLATTIVPNNINGAFSGLSGLQNSLGHFNSLGNINGWGNLGLNSLDDDDTPPDTSPPVVRPR